MIDSYEKMSLEKFLEVKDFLSEEKEDIELQTGLISILNDMDEDSVLNLPLGEYKELAAKTAFLFKSPERKTKCPKEIKVNGKVYSLIGGIKDMTAGQYIDYQTYLSMQKEEFLPNIIACFLIPKGKKYNTDYNMEDAIKDIKEMPIETVLSIADFFMKQSQLSTRATLLYLAIQTKRMARKEKDKETKEKLMTAARQMRSLSNMLRNGDGYQAWILSRKP